MKPRKSAHDGFTLVELLVSMVILSLIMVVSVQVVGQTQKTWKQSVTRVEQFREARMAFESISRDLKQAMLNTYLTYRYNNGATPTIPASKDEAPLEYIRQSELQFVTGRSADLLPSGASSLATHAVFFQARLGVTERDGYESLNRLLCERGYFVMRGDDQAYRPAHVTQSRVRFRLWEYRPPAEENEIYSLPPGQWFQDAAKVTISASETAAKPAVSRPVAENIIALIISPQVTSDDAADLGKDVTYIAPNYAYDSTKKDNVSLSSPQGTQHMLPPIVQITMVAIDESSARLLQERNPGALPDLVFPGAFARASDYQADLKTLEDKLVSEKLNYRVFTSTLEMRNSKWGLLR